MPSRQPLRSLQNGPDLGRRARRGSAAPRPLVHPSGRRRAMKLPTGVLAGSRTPRRLPRLVGLLVLAFALVEGLLIGMGLLVTRALDDTGLHQEELELQEEILEARTPTWNGITLWGTILGSTGVIIAVTAAGCLLLMKRGQGPRLPCFLALAVAGETALFLLA